MCFVHCKSRNRWALACYWLDIIYQITCEAEHLFYSLSHRFSDCVCVCVCVCSCAGVWFGLYFDFSGNYGENLKFRHMNESTKMILVHMRCKVLNNLNLQQPMRSHISFQYYNIWQLVCRLLLLDALAGSYYALMLRDMLMLHLYLKGFDFSNVLHSLYTQCNSLTFTHTNRCSFSFTLSSIVHRRQTSFWCFIEWKKKKSEKITENRFIFMQSPIAVNSFSCRGDMKIIGFSRKLRELWNRISLSLVCW